MEVELPTDSRRSLKSGLLNLVEDRYSDRPLENILGIEVQPVQVRLKPSIEDGYKWRILPERQHLFIKQLNKHSVGAYMELYREVGKFFKAVTQLMTGMSLLNNDTEVGSLSLSKKSVSLLTLRYFSYRIVKMPLASL
jgi:hypothetical protein